MFNYKKKNIMGNTMYTVVVYFFLKSLTKRKNCKTTCTAQNLNLFIMYGTECWVDDRNIEQ